MTLLHPMTNIENANQIIHVLSHRIQEFYHPAYKSFISQLPLSMKTEIFAYRFHEDRIRKAVGRLLLSQVLKNDGLDLKHLDKTPYGKPYVKGWYPFNISHSEQMVVLVYAANTSATGIDVEFIKNIDLKSMLTQLHTDEIQQIQSAKDPLKGFYEIWTKKEALIKAKGTGLTDHLPELNCSGSSTVYDGKKWHFSSIQLGESYAASVASEHFNCKIRLQNICLE